MIGAHEYLVGLEVCVGESSSGAPRGIRGLELRILDTISKRIRYIYFSCRSLTSM